MPPQKKVKVMTGILACTCRSWGHQAEPCGWIYARHVEREPWRIAFKQFQNWSKVNSEIHSREDFLDTKANQPCGYLSQRLSQTAASCSCSCSSDESSWLHFPQPLYSSLVRQGTSSQYQYCYLDLVIWYTICQLNQFSTNSEAAMLSSFTHKLLQTNVSIYLFACFWKRLQN